MVIMTKTHILAPAEAFSLPSYKKLFRKEDLKDVDQNPLQSIVRGLLFIAWMTRHEISIQVNLLWRRASKSSPANLKPALGTLDYLYFTRREGITLRKPSNLNLWIFADDKYRVEKARLQTGVLMTLGMQLVGWYSRTQDMVSLSMTEAEYIAAC